MFETFILVIVIGATLYWYTALQSKTWAVNYARRECERAGVQLLDQTVQQLHLSMSRNNQDQWKVWREYRFEYSNDGINRFDGRLVLLGNRLVRSALEHFDPIIH